jgi:CubicO group peptidase (beta-lactamase class C family)
MRIVLKVLLWLAAILALALVLCHITGNEHLVRGMRYTYLIGRNGPEIDDRDFFPYSTLRARNAQPWPKHTRYGQAELTAEQKSALAALNSTAFVVVQDGQLLFEQYWDGWHKDSVSNSFSVAKSYISLLAGIALREGVLRNVQQPVGDLLPEYAQGCYARLTVEHLLTMSTGLDWSESGDSPSSDNAKGYYGHHVRELSLGQPCRDTPGTRFDYISGSTQIMAEALEEVYGEPLNKLVEDKIWGPLGAEHEAYWGMDSEEGDMKAFCCLYATARDFARIGQLYLDSGRWQGRALIPQAYWQASLVPAPILDGHGPNKRYGYFWWLAELEGRPIWYCRGFHGQYVIVLPHERTVIVRTGKVWEDKNAEGHPKDVFQWIAIGRELANQQKV